MNQSERDEAEQWLERFESQREAMRDDLIKYEESLSQYTIAAIKNAIQAAEYHIKDIEEVLGGES